ncbi:MAG: bacteriocin-protection protein [Flavobacterium sp.]|nr:MAG: bacteriocin-protection protein [Flavobacterium sp.]
MEVHFFDAAEFREWLEKNHKTEREVYIGFYKKATGKEKMDWPAAVDQAICFGWIDGVRRSIDSESYCNRFTPRKPTSIWSNVNIKKVENLTKQGLMKPAGIAAFEKRKPEKSGIYNFETEAKTFTPEMEHHFQNNIRAWEYFSAQPPGYKKLNIHRVVSAKQEKTQWSRLEKLIEASAAGKRLD